MAKFWLHFARGCMSTVVPPHRPVSTPVQLITTGEGRTSYPCVVLGDIGHFNGDKRHPFLVDVLCGHGQRSIVVRKPTN